MSGKFDKILKESLLGGVYVMIGSLLNINSKTPEEIVISILCDFKSKDVKLCLRAMLQAIKDTVVEETKRLKYIRQLEVLSQLRNLQEELCKEVNEMALVYDIERDVRYRQGKEKGREEGREKGREEGLIKGLREGIQLAIELKFGIEGVSLINMVDHIDNSGQLEHIKDCIKKATSTDELRQNMLGTQN